MALKGDAECSQTLLTCDLLMWTVALFQLIMVQFVGMMTALLWQKKNTEKNPQYNLGKSLHAPLDMKKEEEEEWLI